MDLRRLRYFLAVAEELNVSRAARKLHIAQPPLSRQIQALEHEMGVALFHRTNKQISLTEAGLAFSKRARGVIEAAEAAVADAQRVQRHERGTISIGLSDQIAYTLLPPILSRFRGKYPGIDIDLKWFPLADQIDALERQDSDIAFVRPVVDLHGASKTLLIDEPFVAAMGAHHPLALQHSVHLADCAAYTLIGYARDRAPDYHAMITQACAAAGFSANTPLLVDQIVTALALASTGAGIALVPLSARRLQFDSIVYRTLKGANDIRNTAYLAWRHAQPSELLREFVATATDIARSGFVTDSRVMSREHPGQLEVSRAMQRRARARVSVRDPGLQ
jgi:DNA-binding transcriptional LysR family regulator